MGHIAEALSLLFVSVCVWGGGGWWGVGGGLNQIQDSVANVFVSYMNAPTFIKIRLN